jgi:hypothetical protein
VRAYTGSTLLWEQTGTSSARLGNGCSHTFTYSY